MEEDNLESCPTFVLLSKMLEEKVGAFALEVARLADAVFAVGDDDEVEVFVGFNQGVDDLQGR